MKKILVTGSEGQLGKEIQSICDRYPHYDFLFLSKKELDITNEENLIVFFDKEKIDILINCAAYTKVDLSEQKSSVAKAVNSSAVSTLSRLAVAYNFCLIHISTDYVFDGEKKTPYTENDPCNPLGVYGRTKFQGEREILNIKPRGIIIRTSWLYSTYRENFFNKILELSKTNNEIKVVNDQFGTPTYAAFLAETILKIIGSDSFVEITSNPEIFHISNEGSCSWFDFASRIVKKTESTTKIIPCTTSEYPSDTKRPSYSVLDNKKAHQIFGLKPLNWLDSLDNCINRD